MRVREPLSRHLVLRRGAATWGLLTRPAAEEKLIRRGGDEYEGAARPDSYGH